MLLEILLFLLGLVFLVKGADLIVDAAARIAKFFGVSDFLVGLTIVAIGTSLPELAASLTAAAYGDTTLAVGNIIGSNIANIGLILGLSGAFAVIKIDKEIYHRDGFLLLLAVLLFYFFAFDGLITIWEGALFIWIFLAYLFYFITMKRKFKSEFHFGQYLSEFIGIRKKPFISELEKSFYAGLDFYAYKEILKGLFYEMRKLMSTVENVVTEQAAVIRYMAKQVVFFVIGIAGVLFGADLVVKSASTFPIPSVVIGLVFISIGTSLPELAVAVMAIKKRYQNIMIGNVIGSNIANIFLVGGITAFVRPIVVPQSTILIHIPFLLALTWLFLVFSRNDYKLSRFEAITFLIMYIAFVAYLFLTMGV